MVTRGRGGRGYGAQDCGPATRILQRHARPDYPASLQLDGIRVRLCRTRLSHNPALAGMKHLNRLEQVLARSEWVDTGIREGLIFDMDGHLVEGTMSNVFLVLDERLITPRLSSCGVAGVMRSVILELAEALGLPVQLASITAGQLSRADELFLTNSLIGIWPVRSVDKRDCRIGPVTRQLQDALSGLQTDGERWCCDTLQGDGDA
jgi:4-amino-4-deoxychorismate lyase